MEWEHERVTPTSKHVLQYGDVRLSVYFGPDGNGQLWQYCTVSFGEHSDRTIEECCEEWPREAIAKARAVLDELEAKLDEEK